jgi:hypothetical protein
MSDEQRTPFDTHDNDPTPLGDTPEHSAVPSAGAPARPAPEPANGRGKRFKATIIGGEGEGQSSIPVEGG